MSQYRQSNSSLRYVLMAIDSFSRFVVAYRQKSKSGLETLANIKNLVRKFSSIKFFMTDKRSEFTNKHVKQFLKEKKIHLYFSQNEEIKCAIVERVNRTIHAKLMKLFMYKNLKIG